ncbi:MAG: hypothetical protein AVDCRST_MAG11-2330, partial [uncultured Gemmatimonadaceae bacterium]
CAGSPLPRSRSRRAPVRTTGPRRRARRAPVPRPGPRRGPTPSCCAP